MCLQTADNWGTDPWQCLVPGYARPPLFILRGDGRAAPTSYPITYDRGDACDHAVFTTDLVDVRSADRVLGQLHVWKTYSDRLHVTVTLNATGFALTDPDQVGCEALHDGQDDTPCQARS